MNMNLRDIPKVPEIPLSVIRQAITDHMKLARIIAGHDVKPGASVLDFGCGIGHSVGVLLASGYDAHGVDVRELWGADYGDYWNIADKPAAHVAERLRVVRGEPYTLPYPDGYFDFAFSDQVFEHIADYPRVLSELARVIKPGAVSMHRFPGPGRLMEGHLGVPFPVLCRSSLYLSLCALLGIRNARQGALSWRETAEQNRQLMTYNYYPTRRTLQAHARAAGVTLEFAEVDDFLHRGGGRLAPLLRVAAKIGADRALLSLIRPLLQRYMIVRKA